MQSAVIDHPDRCRVIDDDLPNWPDCSPMDSAQSRRAARQQVTALVPGFMPGLKHWLRPR
jgi:hypothetical protein